MKIKEEKAGSKAKCPKCQQAFVVPDPAAASEAAAAIDEDPDLPYELTPMVETSAKPDVLGRDGVAGSAPRTSSRDTDGANKPSVASLMKDFAAKKKKGKRADTEEVATASAAQTSGTAADALARAYQQKRANAGAPKPAKPLISADRRLMLEYFAKAIPAVLIAVLLGYCLYAWVTRDVYRGPPLVQVSGTLTRNGQPLAGMQVRLVPVLSGDELLDAGSKDGPPARSSSTGRTDAQGKFQMMYTALIPGVTIGPHTMEIADSSGIPFNVSEDLQQQNIPENGITDLKINLK